MHKRWHIVVRQLACLSVRMHTAAAIAAGSLHDEVALLLLACQAPRHLAPPDATEAVAKVYMATMCRTT